MKRILVYGTLRRNHRANRYLRDAKFVEEVRVPGFDMFSIGWFPGVKENPDNKDGIVGEIFTLPDHLAADTVEILDHYEGYFPDNLDRSLFLRKEVDVGGQPTTMYLYNGKTEGNHTMKVPSGNWQDVQ